MEDKKQVKELKPADMTAQNLKALGFNREDIPALLTGHQDESAEDPETLDPATAPTGD